MSFNICRIPSDVSSFMWNIDKLKFLCFSYSVLLDFTNFIHLYKHLLFDFITFIYCLFSIAFIFIYLYYYLPSSTAFVAFHKYWYFVLLFFIQFKIFSDCLYNCFINPLAWKKGCYVTYKCLRDFPDNILYWIST